MEQQFGLLYNTDMPNPRSFKKSSRTKKRSNLYYLMAGTGLVCFWWGVWGLLEYFLFPNHIVFNYAIGIALGLCLMYFNDRRLQELE